MINYDLAFAYCAYENGTPLSYLGIWNETVTMPDTTTRSG
jgi:hypothetical protein